MQKKTMYLTGFAICAVVIVGLLSSNALLPASMITGAPPVDMNAGGVDEKQPAPVMPVAVLPDTDPRAQLCKKGVLGSGIQPQKCGVN